MGNRSDEALTGAEVYSRIRSGSNHGGWDLEDGGDFRDDGAPMGDDMDGGMEIPAVRTSDEN